MKRGFVPSRAISSKTYAAIVPIGPTKLGPTKPDLDRQGYRTDRAQFEPQKHSPRHYRKLVAKKLSADFESAVEVVEENLPVPTATQVLVRNCFASVSARFDTLLCRGEIPYAKSVLPVDLGSEAVGVVEAVGSSVTRLSVGDAIATSQSGCGYREYQVIESHLALKVKAATPEVLTLLSDGISALVGLEQVGDMGVEETVLITEAANGVGHIAVQLAKLLGNYVIATCGTASEQKLLETLGCDRVINYREENTEEVLGLLCTEGIDLVFDCVGKQMFDIGINYLAKRGRFVVTDFATESGKIPERIVRPLIYEKLFWKSASVRGFVLSHYAEHIPAARDRLLNIFYNNLLEIKVDPTPFEGVKSIPKAIDYLLSGRNCGKVVIRY